MQTRNSDEPETKSAHAKTVVRSSGNTSNRPYGPSQKDEGPLLSEGSDKMLRVTANTQLMREIIDLLSVLAEEAKLVWGEGLHTIVVDGSHVALLSATIGDECFET